MVRYAANTVYKIRRDTTCQCISCEHTGIFQQGGTGNSVPLLLHRSWNIRPRVYCAQTPRYFSNFLENSSCTSSAKFDPHSFKSNGRLTKSKGFRHVYAKDTKPIYDDDAYLVSTDDDKKKKYELNDKA